MSVTTLQSLFQYAIASLGQAYSPNCAIQNASDFVVTDTNATTLVDTVLTLNVDYTVTGPFTNGVCSAPTVTLEGTGLHYAVGDTLTIQRKPPDTQVTTFVDGTKYLAATTNNALDWLCYSVQALYDIVSRCIQVPPTSVAQSPIPLALRKSSFLGFDASGNVTINPVAPTAAAFLVNNAIVGPTGGGSTHLDGVDCTALAIGTIIQFTFGGIGAGAATQYQLTTSSATPGPGIVAALNKPSARWIQIL